jgi:tetratricopeptide (TPR) repeat protein
MDTLKGTKIPDFGVTQHYDVIKELGDCYVSVGKLEKARECYEKAAVLAPDEAGPYVGLGVICMQEQQLDDAETSFKVACRLDRESARAYCGLALVYQQKNEHSQAFDMYLKSLDIDSDNLTALLGLFQVSSAMGSFAKVAHYLEVYLDSHPGDTSVMFCLATLHLKDSRFEEARQLLSDITLLNPENSDAANLLEEVERAIAEQEHLQQQG